MMLNVFKRSCLPLLACSLCRLESTLAHSWLSSGSPSRSWPRKLGVRAVDEGATGFRVEEGVVELDVEQGDDAGVLLDVKELLDAG